MACFFLPPTKANGSPRKVGRPQAKQKAANEARSVQESFINREEVTGGVLGGGLVSGVNSINEISNKAEK